MDRQITVSSGPLSGVARKGDLFQYDGPLSEVDPEVASIIQHEKQRQVGFVWQSRQRRQQAAMTISAASVLMAAEMRCNILILTP